MVVLVPVLVLCSIRYGYNLVGAKLVCYLFVSVGRIMFLEVYSTPETTVKYYVGPNFAMPFNFVLLKALDPVSYTHLRKTPA